ncbi:hypothetical protein PAAG_05567 [Paracoccidioides lutzii Pb01]|uniref:GmrSD restriction endonucleases C-terminal domain-containing protein n=1 Tax=Paracoccidioides lutzii (strain ATCC MYA-826 / Pb01) TaxID=502779 RepID=C1H474_PARBA|nr:hypothetical protein PAAG_05567 [Paracoccidioides lutzii Pb01]EEH34518.2 hypothetical protein PAAG_05567 [Paracoccidioides lutzii Pb01]
MVNLLLPPSSPHSLTTLTLTSTIPLQHRTFPNTPSPSGAHTLLSSITDVGIGADCSAKSGSWYSVYDGVTWTRASDVDIDHVVPLSNAWKSGADKWTTDTRRSFANDLENPQLVADTDNVNQDKSDSGPEKWKPPLASYHCEYACMWVKVKFVYDLTVTRHQEICVN